MNECTRSNRLSEETSPYLLQHAGNPVDWFPWGQEALEKARHEDRPILLSIGYAACHWCHVMERESFEDEEIATSMNEGFVCIKVDREERPDLDDIYMNAVQMMTGHGGWPLTVFLTPELKPFFGGTYFPPGDRAGMPGFPRVLQAVRRSFEEQRSSIESAADDLVAHISRGALGVPGGDTEGVPGGDAEGVPAAELIDTAVDQYRRRFEPVFGGFSHAPKFPHPMAISLLLRSAQRLGDADVLHMATLSLDRMAYGGIYDQLAGGFHRYSTDDRWLAPHFEKMLYDNALLAGAYVEATQLTGHAEYARVATETLDWVIRDMQSPEGGYYSTLDADSEGVEGKFYVWEQAEIERLLGEDAAAFCSVYDVSEDGNWEGKNILNLAKPAAAFSRDLRMDPDRLETMLDGCRRTLLDARERRLPPALDDKVLTDWNGLMIASMAKAYRALDEPRFLESARRAAEFALGTMIVDGRLLHSYRAGRPRLLAYIDDYANLLCGLIELFESTFELEWLRQARRLADAMIELFRDEAAGGFFFTGRDHEELIARMKPGHDGATPSGNGVAALSLLRLETLTGDAAYGDAGREVLATFGARMASAPTGFAQLLTALDYRHRDPREIVLVGPSEETETRSALTKLWREFRPNDLIIGFDPARVDPADAGELLPLLAGKKIVDDRLTIYACANYACAAPTHDLEEVRTTGATEATEATEATGPNGTNGATGPNGA